MILSLILTHETFDAFDIIRLVFAAGFLILGVYILYLLIKEFAKRKEKKGDAFGLKDYAEFAWLTVCLLAAFGVSEHKLLYDGERVASRQQSTEAVEKSEEEASAPVYDKEERAPMDANELEYRLKKWVRKLKRAEQTKEGAELAIRNHIDSIRTLYPEYWAILGERWNDIELERLQMKNSIRAFDEKNGEWLKNHGNEDATRADSLRKERQKMTDKKNQRAKEQNLEFVNSLPVFLLNDAEYILYYYDRRLYYPQKGQSRNSVVPYDNKQ